MIEPDFQGPYEEFSERLADISKVVCAVEVLQKTPNAIRSTRSNIDLQEIGGTASNNANAMAIVFIASSYEEFIREELSETASMLCDCYANIKPSVRFSIRNAYWKASLQRLSKSKSILTKSDPQSPDPMILAEIRPMLDVAHAFVVDDSATRLDAKTVVYHSNNFRPEVVDELGARLGIKNLTQRTADAPRIKTYFSTSRTKDSYALLKNKLDEFYIKRNEIVHSLNSSSGYGVDYVLDWIALFELVAQSTIEALQRATAEWKIASDPA